MSGFTLHSFDVALLIIPIIGGLWGWFGGGLRTFVKLIFICVPSFVLAYYGDNVAAIGNTIGDMLGSRTSLPLGVIGSVSGILGMLAIVSLCYLLSQVMLGFLHLHKPGNIDHNVGIGIGAVGFVLFALVGFIFFIKAFPDRATRFVEGSYAWPYSRPAIAYSYPYIGGFMDRRMSALINGLSENGLLARIAVGGNAAALSAETFDKVIAQIKQVDFKEVLKLQKAAAELDPNEAQKLVNAYKSGELSEERLREQLSNPDLHRLSGEATK